MLDRIPEDLPFMLTEATKQEVAEFNIAVTQFQSDQAANERKADELRRANPMSVDVDWFAETSREIMRQRVELPRRGVTLGQQGHRLAVALKQRDHAAALAAAGHKVESDRRRVRDTLANQCGLEAWLNCDDQVAHEQAARLIDFSSKVAPSLRHYAELQEVAIELNRLGVDYQRAIAAFDGQLKAALLASGASSAALAVA
jgi:hypothetical protein